MRTIRKTTVLIAATTMAISGAALAGELAERSAEETDPPFGGEANVAYAQALWEALAEQRFVGEGGILTFPYEGTQPHGKVLELLTAELSFEDHTGPLIVKRNYVGEDDADMLQVKVLENRMEHLDSITVMFQREEGYDPEFRNWFWVKYAADGTLSTNPEGMELAGRVAKGAAEGGEHGGCIACHASAPGGNYIYTRGLMVE